MRTFAQSALTISLAAALLGGCGGSQPPIGAPAATLQESPWSAAQPLSASYQQLYRFHPPFDGAQPYAGLLNVKGTLYGTTYAGGLSHKGTVYRISPSGAHKVLYRFLGRSDGRNPMSGLTDVNGTLYGTTFLGGDPQCGGGCGTVYSVNTSGAEKVLYAFTGGSDGAFPVAGLVDVKGTLYGTTEQGGGGCATNNECGTVFSITTSGTERVLHSFGGNDGAFPEAGLIAVNGTLYGTTQGSSGGGVDGTVFSISTSGKEKVLYWFGGGSDGANPYASLINVNGTLYGTTLNGGGSKCNRGYGCGTVFAITTSGQETVLHAFDGSDGDSPASALIDVNGTLYGTTIYGGANGGGTVYGISASGAEQVLHSFGASGDGIRPMAGLIEVNATLYGTTIGGERYVRRKIHDHGTVFALTP